MSFIELFLIGIGLSMDAFAVSLCKGLSMRKLDYKQGFLIAVFFGGFQALMPFIGWFLGRQFERYITSYDHWITFILLSFIGGKMILDTFKKNEDEANANGEKINIKELILLSVATSIDALAVGITFAFLQVSIIPAITVIGITTLTLSFLGVVAGNRFGAKYQDKTQLAGGIVLILIGLKILFEHLFM